MISLIALMLSFSYSCNEAFIRFSKFSQFLYVILSTLSAGGADLGARPPAAGSLHRAGCEDGRAGRRQDPRSLLLTDSAFSSPTLSRDGAGLPSTARHFFTRPTPSAPRRALIPSEHSFIVRVPRAKKAPSLIPIFSSAAHSPSQDSPFHCSPSSPARLGIQVLAACPL